MIELSTDLLRILVVSHNQHQDVPKPKKIHVKTYSNASCNAQGQHLISVAKAYPRNLNDYLMLQFCPGLTSCLICQRLVYDDFSCPYFIRYFCFLCSTSGLYLCGISGANCLDGKVFTSSREKKSNHAFGDHRDPHFQ